LRLHLTGAIIMLRGLAKARILCTFSLCESLTHPGIEGRETDRFGY
jgi:hypothetical protein